MSERQPLPWKNERDGVSDTAGDRIAVTGFSLPCGVVSPDDPCWANTDFIVRACNAHDELVAALELSALQIRDALPYTPDHRARCSLEQAIDDIGFALTKARGTA